MALKFNILVFFGLGVIAYALFFALTAAILFYYPETNLLFQATFFFQILLLALLIVLGHELEISHLREALWTGFALALGYALADIISSLFIGNPAYEIGRGFYLLKTTFSNGILILAAIQIVISTVVAAVGLFVGLLAAKYVGKH